MVLRGRSRSGHDSIQANLVKIVFIGGGNMAAALIGGITQQGVPASDLRVIDVSDSARARLRQMGIAAEARWEDSAAADVVIFAVKPQVLRQVASELRSRCASALIISIAAGIRCRDISRWLGGHERIVRVMPNTPALIRAGVSGLFAMHGVSDADRETAQRIIGAAGKCLWFEREEQLDAVTAVSGSGPAYVFYFIEALEEAALELGIEAEAARELAIGTFLGAARLAAGASESPAALRVNVTSKGGTTEAALASLASADIKRHIVEAVRRANARARELGDQLGHD